MEIIQATVVVVLGTFFLAVGIAGYFRKALSVWERCAFFAAAVCLILPSTITDWIGLAIGVAACLLFRHGEAGEGRRLTREKTGGCDFCRRFF